ncbi:diagnostic antigen gp50 [Echinococcus multilocularis]|uniref:Diagnostic antigen gp50 n=1 Tax=Echinococcus multilocularis TaxID=6211 RepID=A0A087VWW7_ECHMU|nr:diagnostic antigen gp50 [Echinococcus multilocularis]
MQLGIDAEVGKATTNTCTALKLTYFLLPFDDRAQRQLPRDVKWPTLWSAILVSNKESVGELTIEDGQCMVNGTIWGSPCTEGNHAANITVKDVSSQNRLDIFTTRDFTTPFSTTVFAPYCEFPKPDKDEVDVQTSFPLSRFVKGQKSFELAFAIGGADSNGTAHFVVDGERACEWRGHKLVENNTDLCTDLEANRTSDLRVFRVILPTTSDKPFASFIWGYYTSYLTVTVDFTQSGE